MSTFVLEIGTEELPSRFLSNVEKELADRFTAGLKEAGYTFSLLDTCATPVSYTHLTLPTTSRV